jgi:hypothetical protein
MPWFGLVLFFVVLPLVRLLLPDDGARPRGIDEISPLHLRLPSALPLIHVALWILVLPWIMSTARELPTGQLIWFALSCWVVTSLNLTVAHELLHSPLKLNRTAARLVAGSIGYFQLVEEHKYHHAIVGDAESGDSPETSETVFVFALKRYVRSFSVAWQWETLDRLRRRRSRWMSGIIWTALVTLFVLACFGAVAGWRGFLL